MSATLDYREAMRVDLPDIEHDGLKVDRIVVDEVWAARGLREAMFNRGRGRLHVGQSFNRLFVDGTLWMSDTPDEKHDHTPPYFEAMRRGGRMLVHGLGLGMVVNAMLRLDNVEHVDVVELDQRVIDAIGAVYTDRFPGRVTIHHGDAYTFKFPPGTRWSVVWHDVWPTITGANWEGMNRLHRRYGRASDWQGSWARYEVQRLVREDRKWGW